jgi:hypothetical protein
LHCGISYIKFFMVARVFPSKTEMSPTDEHAYFDCPPKMILSKNQYSKINISVTFTWDIPHAKWLAHQWEEYGNVMIGGPALDDPGKEFEPGLYMKPGCVFTSRGCPNSCWYCVVPKREGAIRELKIHDGNIVMDNNLLACSEKHIQEVFKMLSDKRKIDFNQGLEARLITKDIADEIRKLKLYRVFLACDRPGDFEIVEGVIRLLNIGRKLWVYLLSGYDGDTPERADERCIEIARLGAYPFMMLYQPPTKKHYSQAWCDLARKWDRPAAWKTFMKDN